MFGRRSRSSSSSSIAIQLHKTTSSYGNRRHGIRPFSSSSSSSSSLVLSHQQFPISSSSSSSSAASRRLRFASGALVGRQRTVVASPLAWIKGRESVNPFSTGWRKKPRFHGGQDPEPQTPALDKSERVGLIRYRFNLLVPLLERAPLRHRLLWWSQLVSADELAYLIVILHDNIDNGTSIADVVRMLSPDSPVNLPDLCGAFIDQDARSRAPTPKLLVDVGLYLLDYGVGSKEKLIAVIADNIVYIASKMGDVEAERISTRLHYHKERGLRLRDSVEHLVETREDWVAMGLKAAYLRASGRLDEALDMGLEACQATDPGPVDNPWAGAVGLSDTADLRPWEIWASVLDADDEQGLQEAWKYGAMEWDDPHACARHAMSKGVRLGTEHWLQYATKAAMAGHIKSMQDVGKYHLALHGWYPHDPTIRKTHFSKHGFCWLQLSTIVEAPDREAKIWAGLAMVLRGCGDREGAKELLRQGLERVEMKCSASDVSEDDKKDAMKQFESLEEAWHVTRMVSDTGDGSSVPVDARFFLGNPVIPVWG